MASLAKNLKNVTPNVRRAVVTWDKAERIQRNEEIFKNSESVVHRLPEHYKTRYWETILSDKTPVHYRPPTSRFAHDSFKNVEIELEENPIIGIRTPEGDDGLWGGERVVKGWIESAPYTKKKILPRYWVPKLFFPALKNVVLYSEILDKYIKVTVTERAMRLIDEHFGLDYYILESKEIDLDSKFANSLKREMLLTLTTESYYEENDEKKAYIKEKYADFVIPEREAEWIGLELNEAARKQQDMEDSTAPEPLKYKFEQSLLERLRDGTDEISQELENPEAPMKTESKFGDKMFGKYLNPIGKKLRSATN
ncbi:Large ribosomal subunit protein bL28m [Caenorhabditis elegans]|uniref:Large ribosomal subunit protein bL28m n=1 Tax=Caenorhabditis elegans TaxID=6239 RepID=O76606_CAEEL|nr:Large ribosomal subunit protein bL28m [Caenorhabditis elegans]CCD72839.1 Large ribosomal subunit protein bL28m [Caenorhabditis elegans]|eukprot:NP_493672.1 Mitochondrial Ribosomal Protein, Large [Caenorhabditis elegans]